MDDSDLMSRLCAIVLDPAVSVCVSGAGQHVGQGGFHGRADRTRTFDLDYFVEGEAVFIVNGVPVRARRGDAVLRFPGDRVSAEFPIALTTYHAHFDLPGARRRVLDPSDPRELRALEDYLPNPHALLLPEHVTPTAQGRAVELLDAMAADFARSFAGARARVTAHLVLLLDLLNAEVAHSLTGRLPETARHHHVTRAVRFVEGRLHNRISLAEVARGLHVSADYLSRIFRQEMGATVVEHIRSRRVERSKGLLVGSALSIKEIALRVGIADPLYFCRLFRRVAGVSPSEFRGGHRPTVELTHRAPRAPRSRG
jgi:AraC-like DNA-binding protein